MNPSFITLILKEFRLAVANGLIDADPEAPQMKTMANAEIINELKPYR